MKLSLIFILSLSSIFAQQSPQPSPTPVETSQEQQQLGTGKKNNSTKRQPTTKSRDIAKEDDSTKDRSGQDGHKSTPDWITWLTGVIAVAAVLQFIVFCFQAYYMYVGIGLTKQAADAATQSIQVLNRARIRFEAVAFQNIEDFKRETFQIVWRATNTGPTTGHIFEQRNDYFISDQPLPTEPPWTDKPLPRHIHLGPNQGVNVTVD